MGFKSPVDVEVSVPIHQYTLALNGWVLTQHSFECSKGSAWGMSASVAPYTVIVWLPLLTLKVPP